MLWDFFGVRSQKSQPEPIPKPRDREVNRWELVWFVNAVHEQSYLETKNRMGFHKHANIEIVELVGDIYSADRSVRLLFDRGWLLNRQSLGWGSRYAQDYAKHSKFALYIGDDLAYIEKQGKCYWYIDPHVINQTIQSLRAELQAGKLNFKFKYNSQVWEANPEPPASTE